jgi:hypothetical protein
MAKKRLIAISTSIPPPIRGFDDHRHERQRDRADRPEPTRAERRDPLAVIGAHFRNHPPRRGEDIWVDLETRSADAGRRDKPRRGVAGERNRHQLGHHAEARAALRRGETADDEPADDRREGRALNQRIAGDELLAPQMVGQNAVFDRPEQGRDAAEPEQRHIEQGERGEDETGRCDHLHADFRELQPPRHVRLVVRVGDLAPERRERDRRQNEDHRGEKDFEAAVFPAEAEEDQHRQHVADEIVVEGGEELAPEQRREPPRGHQGPEHDGFASFWKRPSKGR